MYPGVLMTSMVASALAADASAVIEPIYLHLPVTDPETVAALAEVADGKPRAWPHDH